MKLKQIVEQTDKDLKQLLDTSQTDLAEAIIELKTQKTPNVKRITGLKKTIARVKTIERQRELTKLASSEAAEPTNAKVQSQDKIKRNK